MASVLEVTLFSLFAFLGSVGLALTGFGMGIIYLFCWQVAVLCGFESNYKDALVLQALALLSSQPLLIHKAELRKYALRRVLVYFVPATILAVPVGQFAAELVSTDLLQTVGGILVLFAAGFEIWKKREQFRQWTRTCVSWVSCGQCCEDSQQIEEETSAEALLQPETARHNGFHRKKGTNQTTKSTEYGSFTIAIIETVQQERAPDQSLPLSNNVVGEGQPENNNHAAEVVAGMEGTASTGRSNHDCQGKRNKGNTASEEEEREEEPYTFYTIFWTVFAGAMAGFLGGLCGIRAPPMILYFLNPPAPVRFQNKRVQRATMASLRLISVCMRVSYYLINTLAFHKKSFFTRDDWPIYLGTAICTSLGVLAGDYLFQLLRENTEILRGILTIFLVLFGISMLLSSYVGG